MSSLLYASSGIPRGSHVVDSGLVQLSTGEEVVPVLVAASAQSVLTCEHPASSSSASNGVSSILVHAATAPAASVRLLSSSSASARGTAWGLAVGDASGQTRIFTPHARSTAEASNSNDIVTRPDAQLTWRLVLTLPHVHSGEVAALGALSVSSALAADSESPGRVVVTAGSEGTLWIGTLSSEAPLRVVQGQTIDLPSKALPLCLALAAIPGTDRLLLAVGSTTKVVRLYSQQEGPNSAFQLVATLEGHDDWVRALDFCAVSSGNGETELVLATASQDACTRLWRTTLSSTTPTQPETALQEDAFESLAQTIEQDRADDRGITTKAHTFTLASLPSGPTSVTVRFDALLVGHDGWVQDVRWSFPATRPDGTHIQPAALLSCGSDGSAIIWSPSGSRADPEIGLPLWDDHGPNALWLSSARLGEVGGVATGGWYGVSWLPSLLQGKVEVLAHGSNGAAHIFAHTLRSGRSNWSSRPACVGGHLGSVRDVAWAPHGLWFLSAGHDRTTRLHAPAKDAAGGKEYWTEVARPQVHGYAMTGVSFSDLQGLSFVSGAEEKVVRSFDAPEQFVQLAQQIVPRTELRSTLVVDCDEQVDAPLSDPHVLHDALLASLEPFGLHLPAGTFTPRASVTVMLVSQWWDGFVDATEVKVSFKQLEDFLVGVYAQIWAQAVTHDRLDLDVEVLLVPARNSTDRVRTLLAQPDVRKGALFGCAGTHLDASTLSSLNATVLQRNSLPSAPPSEAPEGLKEARPPFPRFDNVALGGTFDHLHVGHKVLLSLAALVARSRLVVGITTDALLAKKKFAEQLEDLFERTSNVRTFITRFRSALGVPELKQELVPLQDVSGPAGTDPHLDALIVTHETIAGAEFIEGERKKIGLGALDVWAIGLMAAHGQVVGHDPAELAATKVGSTALRQWHARFKDEQPQRPAAANVPPLALSNKASFTPSDNTLRAQGPPTEAELISGSLWAETDKLYGHGDPIATVEMGNGLCASAASTHSDQGAQVWLHDKVHDWAPLAQLPGHALGAARVRWSPQKDLLLSVGRDRKWVLHRPPTTQAEKDEPQEVQPWATYDKAHTKAIRDAAWLSNEVFATCSRDRKAKLWQIEGPVVRAGKVISLPVGASALASTRLGSRFILAIGLDDGSVQVWSALSGEDEWTLTQTVQLHAGAVSAMEFRPFDGRALLSAGSDGSIVLVRLDISSGR